MSKGKIVKTYIQSARRLFSELEGMSLYNLDILYKMNQYIGKRIKLEIDIKREEKLKDGCDYKTMEQLSKEFSFNKEGESKNEENRLNK